MILLALTFLIVLIFLYDSKLFIYTLMVFYVLFDMLDGFYEDEKIFVVLRYVIPLILLLAFIVKKSAFKKSDFILIVLALYLFILMVYSPSDIIVSGKTSLAVFLTLLMIPVGRAIGRKVNFIEEYEVFNRFLLVALPVYLAIANILHFGESYSEAFTTGFLITSRMYILPIVLFLAIHYAVTNRNKSLFIRGFDLVFIVIGIGILIINTRRTALGMLAVGLLIYAALNRKLIFKMIISGLLLAAALVFTYPFYEDTLNAQLEKRERIKNLDTYEEEGRVLETIYIIDYHSRKQSPLEILFGVKLFDTYDFGNHYFGRDRPIHSDFNMIFYSTGLVGELLFGLLFIHYFFRKNKRIITLNKRLYYPFLAMFVIVLIPGRFIGTLTYAPLLMMLLSAVKAGLEVPEIITDPVESDSHVEIYESGVNHSQLLKS